MFCDGCVMGDWFKPPPAAKDDDSKTVVSLRPALKFGHCGACLARLAPDRRPQLLPCLHSLCQPCVSQSLAVDYGACPGCPVCGMQYSPEHVTGDLFYKDSRGDPAKPVSECGGCGAVGAGGWCVECGEDLCPACVSAHQRVKVTRLHTVLRLPENPRTDSFWTAYCSSHRREAARLFCQSCEELVCRICEQTLHKGHRFQFVMNAVVKERAALKPLTEHVKQQRTQVRNSLSDLDRRLQDVNALQTQLNDELKDTVLRIRDALLKRALSLCLEVQELCISEERKIRERQEALKKLEERQTYLLSFTDRALDTEGYSALLAYKSKIQCQFEDLASCDVSPGGSMVTAVFCPDSEICSKIQTFGKLVVKMVPFACTGDQNGQGKLPKRLAVCSIAPTSQTESTSSPIVSADSTSCQIPPPLYQIPPTSSQVCPTSSQIRPTSSQIRPTSSQIRPTSSQIPPTSSQIPLTSCQIPPPLYQIPPTSCQIPPTSCQVPRTSSPIPQSSPNIPPTYFYIPPNSAQIPPASYQILTTSSQMLPMFPQAPPTQIGRGPRQSNPLLLSVLNPRCPTLLPRPVSPSAQMRPVFLFGDQRPAYFPALVVNPRLPSARQPPTRLPAPPALLAPLSAPIGPPPPAPDGRTPTSRALACPPVLAGSAPSMQSGPPGSTGSKSPEPPPGGLKDDSQLSPPNPPRVGLPDKSQLSPPDPPPVGLPDDSRLSPPNPPRVGLPDESRLSPPDPPRVGLPDDSRLSPPDPPRVGLPDESQLFGCPVEEANSDRTEDTDAESVPESRTGDGRPLVPRVSLVRLPVSFPLPGGPLPQFRLATSTSRQEVLLEQIPEEGQFSCPDSKSLRPLSLRPLKPPLEPPLVPPLGGRGSCALCHTAGALSSCSECGRSFHSDCLLTPICTTDSGRWQCMVCEDQSDIRVHQSSLSETDPTLSLPDQRECKRLFLTLISDEYSAVLYQQPELLSDSSPYVDVTLIRDRLLHRLSPAYRTLEFVSDVWLLLSSLPKGPEDVKPVERLQRIFQKALKKTFGPSLRPSLPEPAPGKEVAGAGGATGPQGATDAWQTKRKRKRKRKEEAVKKQQAEPLMKKLCKNEEGWSDGGRSGGVE